MRKSAWLTSLTLFCVMACAGLGGDSAKTTFQTGQGWRPALLAASSRAYDLHRTARTFSYTCKSPIDTDNVTRILLRRAPKTVLVDGAPAADCSWDPASRTLFLRFPNSPDGVKVDVRY